MRSRSWAVHDGLVSPEVVPASLNGLVLKREAGVNPGRSRHCDRGVRPQETTGVFALGRCGQALIRESGDLPLDELVVPRAR